MPDKIIKIQNAILEIKNAKIEDLEAASRKYDIVIGSNTIFTGELIHTLKEVFNINATADELNDLVPVICKNLNMKYEGLRALDDIENPKPAAYSITLFDE